MASPTSGNAIQPQLFDYFLVLDFEATCEKDARVTPQEIIEFPVLKVDARTFQVEATFHSYVQPKVHKTLTPFCTELTGITQDMVDGQPSLDETLEKFHAWMSEQGLLGKGTKSVFVTCGDWDLKTMLPGQCKYFSINYGDYLKRWINIKKAFQTVIGVYPRRDLVEMLETLNLQLEGRHHSGIDDCHNIARILKTLAERGGVFKINGQL
jgi:ERI1 exoribonuclease 3